MNDLKELQWQSISPNGARQQADTNANYNPIYQRQNNPFSAKSGNENEGKKILQQPGAANAKQIPASNKAQDSFGGLVDWGGSKKVDMSKMSLAQQAANLQAQKALQAQQSNAQFSDAAFFEAQLSRPSSARPLQGPSAVAFPAAHLKKSDTETSEDILAQINGDVPVNKSSFYPPPPSPTRQVANPAAQNFDFLSQESFIGTTAGDRNEPMSVEDDDILGALGKPVPFPAVAQELSSSQPITTQRGSLQQRSFTPSTDSSDDEDFRRAKAESLRQEYTAAKQTRTDAIAPLIKQLAEMGYTEKQAEVALAQTDSGLDLDAAIDLLLSLETLGTAHATTVRTNADSRTAINLNRTEDIQRRPTTAQNESGDWVDSTYDLASKTLASANNWFSNKSALARRKLAEFNAENAAQTHASRFDERPKWMRDAERYERREKGKGKARDDEEDTIREEGLPMHPAERRRLEMNGVLPPSSRRGSVDSAKSAKSITGSIKSIPESLRSIGTTITGTHPATHDSAATSRQIHASDPRRFKANDDEATTFVSSRRRRPAPETIRSPAPQTHSVISNVPPKEDDIFSVGQSTSTKDKGKGKGRALPADIEDDIFAPPRTTQTVQEEVDLFSAPAKTQQSSANVTESSRKRKSQSMRKVPYLDATILATASQNRLRGSDAFKQGDFVKALSFYNVSLQDIPSMHPVRILSLTNRAITQIQLGAPKPATEDCEEALSIIGANRGQGEIVEDSGKQTMMTALWVKAMTRKASALEMQERNTDALEVWQELVRSGLGGSSAMQSRQRCENILTPKPLKTAAAKVRSTTTSTSEASQAAVRKLREEDARTAETEAEKDSLYAVVNNRITTWSAGKETNLRALLSSLDQVLWPTSGWKKVTLADLVINAKVKVIYMKALAKVHPDKISRAASVEEKMIAAGVFAKLNAAWDAFKAQNNM